MDIAVIDDEKAIREHICALIEEEYPESYVFCRTVMSYIFSNSIRRAYCNGTYEGEYKVLLEMPDNADKNILNSRAELIEEDKDVACILKSGNVIAVALVGKAFCRSNRKR